MSPVSASSSSSDSSAEWDRSDAAFLDDNVINIDVHFRFKRKRFVVHRKLLSKASAKLDFSVAPVHTDKPTVVNFFVDHDAFGHAVHWFYRGTLPEIDMESEDIAQKQGEKYVSLYVWASQWAVLELQNIIIDRIRQRPTCALGWFPWDLIQILREKCEDSELYDYIIDNWLYKARKWDEDQHGDFIQEQMDDNRSFIGRIQKRLFVIGDLSKIEDPRKKNGCVYHIHKDGIACSQPPMELEVSYDEESESEE